ncbi:hypothetical protein Taro_014906 [Colocasia esculenta]|uniref:Uncharacterized protein n=1 Tax=Colocasia esculenta TaxID=4460 RepID=A0A843UKS5_COLES|nr:hypothetical protein [Colocasia esculenta]
MLRAPDAGWPNAGAARRRAPRTGDPARVAPARRRALRTGGLTRVPHADGPRARVVRRGWHLRAGGPARVPRAGGPTRVPCAGGSTGLFRAKGFRLAPILVCRLRGLIRPTIEVFWPKGAFVLVYQGALLTKEFRDLTWSTMAERYSQPSGICWLRGFDSTYQGDLLVKERYSRPFGVCWLRGFDSNYQGDLLAKERIVQPTVEVYWLKGAWLSRPYRFAG